MALFTADRLPWIHNQLFDADGAPLSGGKLQFYAAGTSTPLDTFSSSALTPGTENPNPYILNASGYATDPIYLQSTGYDVEVSDQNDVFLYDEENVESAGAVFASTFGTVQAGGSRDVTSGYTELETDRLITVDSTGGASPCVINLLPAGDARTMLTIKNMGTEELAITPDGVETIDGVAGPFTVPVASSPTFPSVILVSDAVSAWYILASHGL